MRKTISMILTLLTWGHCCALRPCRHRDIHVHGKIARSVWRYRLRQT